MNGDQERIDVNRADVQTLSELLGVGDVLARRIVEYRETVHPFEEVIELAAVPGISERMVRSWGDRVSVGQFGSGVDAEQLPEEAGAAALSEVSAEPEEAGEAVPAQIPAPEPEEQLPAPLEVEADSVVEAPAATADEPEADQATLDVESVAQEAATAEPGADEPHPAPAEPAFEAEAPEPAEAVSDMAEPAEAPDSPEPPTKPEGDLIDTLAGEQAPEVEELVDVRLVGPDAAAESIPAEPELALATPMNGAPSPVETEPPDRGPAPATTREPRRRGAPGWLILISGAVLGLLLSLVALLLLNGTLFFADRESQRDAERASEALSDDLGGARRELGFVSATADALAVDVAVQATQASELASLAERTAAEQEALSGMVARNGHAVSTLESRTAELEAQFDSLADVAEKVELFLQGMRDLLFELEGAPEPTATFTSTPTITATPTPAAKPETTATVAPGATAPATLAPVQTSAPGTTATRTPLPTATPFRGTATPLPNP